MKYYFVVLNSNQIFHVLHGDDGDRFFFVFQAKESPEKTYDISDCELTDVSIALLHHLVV